ncbi:MAG: D-alanyl-D-alanine carboxypeptidase [Gammaproteobacteria bacterium]|nr:D-alanyl-D-alanine carboxypeptidase [Gammaproteobacteria bacterium]
MKKYTTSLVLGVSLLSSTLTYAAESLGTIAPTPTLPNSTLPLLPVTSPHPLIIPNPPQLEGKGWILLDANSGKVLATQNAEARLAPASLTKMMTAYIISSALKQGRLHLEDKVYISEKAWRTGGSKMFVKVGDYVSVRDLLQGIIVDSGNDACIAMAEHLAGSEDAFVELMNQQAKLLGMNNTHFIDSTGMPNSAHYTCARDMATLARAIIFNFPDDYKTYSQKWFVFNNIKQPNRNRLLWRDNSVDGIKTGHTDDAGFCLASSAQRNNMRLIAIVMGEPSDKARADDSQKLLNYGFRFFETKPLFMAYAPVQEIRVWLGKDKLLPVGVAQNVYITVPAGQFRNIQTTIQTADNLKAPVQKNQVVGNIQVTLNNQVILSQPALALKEDPKANAFTRMRDHTHLALQKLFHKKQRTEG